MNKHPVWQYFEKIPGSSMAKCLLCGKLYSYKTSVTNLKKHLISKHKNVKPEIKSAQIKPEKQLVVASNVSNQDDDSNNFLIEIINPEQSRSPLPIASKRRATITTVSMLEERKKIIDERILQMIIHDYQPISLVEDEAFKSFVAALNPNYTLPNRKWISGMLIPEQYLECKNQMMELVTKAKNVCLTTETWTSMAMDSYLAVTAHFIIDYQITTVMLHCEHLSGTHTADELAVVLKNIVEEWKISDKITLAVSDNTECVTSAIKKNGWPIFSCFLYKLNETINNAIQVIHFILAKIKTIVAYFKKSSVATEALINYQIDVEKETVALRLIDSSIPISWNTSFYMLERFLKLQKALQKVIPKLRTTLPVITADMWEEIRQICIILKPFEEITHIMSDSNYLTASLAVVIIDGLKNAMSIMKSKPIFGNTLTFLKKLDEGLNSYFPENEIEGNITLGMCTFLDPRFKIYAFLDDVVEEESLSYKAPQRTRRAHLIKKHVLKLLEQKLRTKCTMPEVENFMIVPSNGSILNRNSMNIRDIEPVSVWRKLDKTITVVSPSIDVIAKNEVELFLNEEILQRNSCPLDWWKSHACLYPNLAEAFNEHYHIVVTSVECDSVYSKAGYLLMQKRSRIGRKRTPELVFLKSNARHCK